MKFKGKDGKVFESIKKAWAEFCERHDCIYSVCPLDGPVGHGGCGEWIADHPAEAARLMGYEIIPEDAGEAADITKLDANTDEKEGKDMSNDAMTPEREGRILEGAIAKFGEMPQIWKAIEELGELSVELARHLNGQGDEAAVREELADAFIMLNQLELIFGDVSDIEIAKLERLELLAEK